MFCQLNPLSNETEMSIPVPTSPPFVVQVIGKVLLFPIQLLVSPKFKVRKEPKFPTALIVKIPLVPTTPFLSVARTIACVEAVLGTVAQSYDEDTPPRMPMVFQV